MRGIEVRDRIKALLLPQSSVRLLTLTIKSDDRPLNEQLDHLYASFRRLRQQRGWLGRVSGGIYVLEITRNARSGQWHPHLHVIVSGSYFPQSELSSQWEVASEGSKIVDVRAVHDRADVTNYLTSYLTKPSGCKDWPPAAIREYAASLHCRRVMGTFGAWHTIKIDEDPGEDQTGSQSGHVNPGVAITRLRKTPDLLRRFLTDVRSLGGSWARLFNQQPATGHLTESEREEALYRMGAAILATQDRVERPPKPPKPSQPPYLIDVKADGDDPWRE